MAGLAIDLKKLRDFKEFSDFEIAGISRFAIRDSRPFAKHSRASRIAHAPACSDFTAEALFCGWSIIHIPLLRDFHHVRRFRFRTDRAACEIERSAGRARDRRTGSPRGSARADPRQPARPKLFPAP